MTPEEANALSIERAEANRRRTRRGMAALWLATVLMFGALAWQFQGNLNDQRANSQRMCEQRRSNTTIINSGYSALAEVERTNRFVDAATRQARVTAYDQLMLAVPNCEPA